MSSSCKYCNTPEDKQNKPCFLCKLCTRLVHLECLRGNFPSALAGDVLFDFTCADCSQSHQEVFTRGKMPWTHALILTLHHLKISSAGISNSGFYHYKTHISCFIDRNWKTLFGGQFKRKKNWIGTLVGALSSHSGVLFQSSAAVLGEAGWWRLLHDFSPAVFVHIIQEMAREKSEKLKARKTTDQPPPHNTFEDVVSKLGYKHLLHQNTITVAASDIPCKKRRTDIDDKDTIFRNQYIEYSDSSHNTGMDKPTTEPLDKQRNASDVQKPDIFAPITSLGFQFPGQLPSSNYDSDSRSRSPLPTNAYIPNQLEESDGWNSAAEDMNLKVGEQKCEPTIEPNKTSLFSNELNSINILPWLRPIEKPDKTLARLTEYEEIQLLKRVESLIPDVANARDRAHLRRFRAKLALRRLKRNKHVPLFDLDKTVKYLGGYSSEDPSAIAGGKERVLDRFQASFPCDGTTEAVSKTFLVGHKDYSPFQSPYSGSILKPFIRRDTESAPLWLRLMNELLQKTNCDDPAYIPQPKAPIDYSYVKPHHIAAVNNLCAQFFWPGVDLTEALQYPEFSCVATYRKLLVGFAFLVPNVARSTAYISFVFTRPEWRKAKIATFMLYHLLQVGSLPRVIPISSCLFISALSNLNSPEPLNLYNVVFTTCTGQDVTLHVSPTNPAIFLYQKFGFKVEELVQDFYEKYFDIASKDCKHAVLLRLTR